jgi:hypothetical protein
MIHFNRHQSRLEAILQWYQGCLHQFYNNSKTGGPKSRQRLRLAPRVRYNIPYCA